MLCNQVFNYLQRINILSLRNCDTINAISIITVTIKNPSYTRLEVFQFNYII